MSCQGFYRGTSHDQVPFFANKEKKMIETKKWPDEFEKQVDMSKVNVSVISSWITKRITEILGFEDEIIIDYCRQQLLPQTSTDVGSLSSEQICPKKLQINMTGFLAKNASSFVKDLWSLLLDAQDSESGIPSQFVEEQKNEMMFKQAEAQRIKEALEKVHKVKNFQNVLQESELNNNEKSSKLTSEPLLNEEKNQLSTKHSHALSPGVSLSRSRKSSTRGQSHSSSRKGALSRHGRSPYLKKDSFRSSRNYSSIRRSPESWYSRTNSDTCYRQNRYSTRRRNRYSPYQKKYLSPTRRRSSSVYKRESIYRKKHSPNRRYNNFSRREKGFSICDAHSPDTKSRSSSINGRRSESVVDKAVRSPRIPSHSVKRHSSRSRVCMHNNSPNTKKLLRSHTSSYTDFSSSRKSHHLFRKKNRLSSQRKGRSPSKKRSCSPLRQPSHSFSRTRDYSVDKRRRSSLKYEYRSPVSRRFDSSTRYHSPLRRRSRSPADSRNRVRQRNSRSPLCSRFSSRQNRELLRRKCSHSPAKKNTVLPIRENSRSPEKTTSRSSVEKYSTSPMKKYSRLSVSKDSHSPVEKDSWLTEKQGSSLPLNKECSGPKRKDSSLVGSTDSRSPKRKDSLSPRRNDTRSPKRKNSRSPGRKNSHSPRSKISRSPKSNYSRSPKSHYSCSPESKNRHSPKRKGSSLPKGKYNRSPKRNYSPSPEKKASCSPATKFSHSLIRQYSRSPVRKYSRSPVRKYSRSPVRKYSHVPIRKYSHSPVRKYSRSPVRKYSRSPVRKYSRSPVRKYSRSPVRKYSRSPVRKYSRSPVRKYSRSPVRKYSRSPVRKYSRSPVRKYSRSPMRKYSRSPMRKYSRSSMRKYSRSSARGYSRSVARSYTRSLERRYSRSARRKYTRSPIRKYSRQFVKRYSRSPLKRDKCSPVQKRKYEPIRKNSRSSTRQRSISTTRRPSRLTSVISNPYSENRRSSFSNKRANRMHQKVSDSLSSQSKPRSCLEQQIQACSNPENLFSNSQSKKISESISKSFTAHTRNANAHNVNSNRQRGSRSCSQRSIIPGSSRKRSFSRERVSNYNSLSADREFPHSASEHSRCKTRNGLDALIQNKENVKKSLKKLATRQSSLSKEMHSDVSGAAKSCSQRDSRVITRKRNVFQSPEEVHCKRSTSTSHSCNINQSRDMESLQQKNSPIPSRYRSYEKKKKSRSRGNPKQSRNRQDYHKHIRHSYDHSIEASTKRHRNDIRQHYSHSKHGRTSPPVYWFERYADQHSGYIRDRKDKSPRGFQKPQNSFYRSIKDDHRRGSSLDSHRFLDAVTRRRDCESLSRSYDSRQASTLKQDQTHKPNAKMHHSSVSSASNEFPRGTVKSRSTRKKYDSVFLFREREPMESPRHPKRQKRVISSSRSNTDLRVLDKKPETRHRQTYSSLNKGFNKKQFTDENDVSTIVKKHSSRDGSNSSNKQRLVHQMPDHHRLHDNGPFEDNSAALESNGKGWNSTSHITRKTKRAYLDNVRKDKLHKSKRSYSNDLVSHSNGSENTKHHEAVSRKIYDNDETRNQIDQYSGTENDSCHKDTDSYCESNPIDRYAGRCYMDQIGTSKPSSKWPTIKSLDSSTRTTRR